MFKQLSSSIFDFSVVLLTLIHGSVRAEKLLYQVLLIQEGKNAWQQDISALGAADLPTRRLGKQESLRPQLGSTASVYIHFLSLSSQLGDLQRPSSKVQEMTSGET